MKEKWIYEQLESYRSLIMRRVIEDLKEAVEYAESGDYESAYRHAGGAVQMLMRQQELTAFVPK